MTVNVHPDIETLNQALLDFIDVFRWRNVAILYKGTEGELLSFQLQRYSAPIATTILCHCEICLSFSWNFLQCMSRGRCTMDYFHKPNQITYLSLSHVVRV